MTLDGIDATTEDSAVLVFDRGTEEVDWWSVYKLGTGEPLFDSYVPVLRLSLSRDVQTLRYVGFEVPPDDAADAKLREPHVVGVLAYASADKVIRRLLLTCSDANRAASLRSFADTVRTLTLEEKGDTVPEPAQTLHLRWSAWFPSPPNPVDGVHPDRGRRSRFRSCASASLHEAPALDPLSPEGDRIAHLRRRAGNGDQQLFAAANGPARIRGVSAAARRHAIDRAAGGDGRALGGAAICGAPRRHGHPRADLLRHAGRADGAACL